MMEKKMSSASSNEKPRATADELTTDDGASRRHVTKASSGPDGVTSSGDGAGGRVAEMTRMLRDTRQYVGELRQRTENALAHLHEINEERRQQLADFQAASHQLDVLNSKLSEIIRTQNASANPSPAAATTGGSERPLPAIIEADSSSVGPEASALSP